MSSFHVLYIKLHLSLSKNKQHISVKVLPNCIFLNFHISLWPPAKAMLETKVAVRSSINSPKVESFSSPIHLSFFSFRVLKSFIKTIMNLIIAFCHVIFLEKSTHKFDTILSVNVGRPVGPQTVERKN